jgi:hypothetical protein
MRASTTSKGLGWAYQQQRKQLLAAMPEGHPCARCGRPMYRGQPLEADHFPGRMYGGPQTLKLSHMRCNRRAGARAGNRRRARRQRLRTSRPW